MSSISVCPFADGTEHLSFELQRLELRLRRQVSRLRAEQSFVDDPFRGLYITDQQVDALLEDKRRRAGDREPPFGLAANGPSVESLTALLAGCELDRAQRLLACRQAGIRLPLLDLVDRFGLDGFEEDVVLLALAPEISRRYETLFAYVQNDVTRKRPTVGLALDLASEDLGDRLRYRTAFAPGAPLIGNRLLRLVDDPQSHEPSLPARQLRLEDRIAAFLLEDDADDGELAPFTETVQEPTESVSFPSGNGVRVRLGHAALALADGGVLFLRGPYGSGKRAAAEMFAHDLGRPLVSADMRIAADPSSALPGRIALLRREALLSSAVLLLEHFECLIPEQGGTPGLLALASELAPARPPIVLGSERTWEPAGLWRTTPFLVVDIPDPPPTGRIEIWRRALVEAKVEVRESDIAAVGGKFVLSPGRIRDAARRAVDLAHARGAFPRLDTDDLHAGARAQSTTGLSRLAQTVASPFQWEDLVLPRRIKQQLREVVSSVTHRDKVHGTWGFESKLLGGKGLNVLFAGPSGTGKTMAAAILARELRLDLYRIDLATVVSKYIGETERNLARVFDEAQSSNAMLFFDEADALFGKRSEVRDAHDRYANLEVAYLLQRMEAYDGVCILATNLSKNMDEAFARRMQHSVEFPFPDAVMRKELWHKAFPQNTPLADDIDFEFLSRQFEFTGGNIKNVAVAASFMAAADDSTVSMIHLVCAVARELGKLGRLPTKSDFRQYYEWMRNWS